MIHAEEPERWGAAKLLATTITGVQSIVHIPGLYAACILQHPFLLLNVSAGAVWNLL